MRHLAIIISLLAGIVFSAPSFAQDAAKPVIPKPLNVMPVKIKPVQDSPDEMSKAAPDTQTALPAADNEHLETLTPRADFVYPSDFWKNSSRAQIADFLSAPTKISQNKIVRDMQLRAVLTHAPHLSAPTATDKNLYALRLNSLTNLGDFDDAITLYKMNDGLPPSPLAARAGTEAMLGKGEIAIACLEQKALDKSLKTDDTAFWNNLDTLCQTLLSPVAGTDDSMRLTNAARVYLDVSKTAIPKDASELNALDMVSTIALLKKNMLSAILDSTDKINLLSDRQLATSLTYTSNDSAAKLPLLSIALKRGIIAPADALPVIGAMNLENVSEGYKAFLKEYLKETPPLLTLSLLTLATTQDKGDLLIPFYAASEIAFPEGLKPLSLKLLTRANQPLPASLVRAAFAIPESPESGEESGEFLLFTHLWEQAQEADKANYLTLLAIKPHFIPEKTANNAYENNFSLTGDSNYVMPTTDSLRELKKSATQKQADQVVVKSLGILTETPLEKLHPLALYQVLEALDSAGLTEETLSLSRYALGALLEKN